MPFAGYKNFADCVKKNKDKDNPSAYCASVHKKATGKWPTELSETEGLSFKHPHGFWLWTGGKTLIIKSHPFKDKIGKELYIIEKDGKENYCYGSIKLTNVNEIDLEDWSRLKDIHMISDEERNDWWGSTTPLYAYNFEFIEKLEKPRKVEVSNNESLNLISDVRFLIEKELARQAFGSPGGKSKIIKRILKFIPSHKTYVECFAGGAAMFWNKEHSEVSILNDFDPEIAHAYKFIKNITPEQINKLKGLDWKDSRNKFFQMKDNFKPKTDIEKFYKFIYTIKTSYGLTRKTYGFKNTSKSQFYNYLDHLTLLSEKLKNVKVFNTSYENIIKKFDSKDTFIYLDPPYPEEWGFKTKAFDKDDYQKMHDILKSIKGKFLMSTNIRPWITEMFKDFHLKKILVPRTFAKKDNPKYEYLISNYKELNDLDATKTPDVKGKEINVQNLQPTWSYSKNENGLKFNCECIDCSYKIVSKKHCIDLSCPKCGGQMRRVERPGIGK